MSVPSELLQELQTLLASGQLDLEQFDLGPVSAYAIAKAHGFTGTEEEFAEMITHAAQNAAIAAASATAAAASEQNAASSERAAKTSETNAASSASAAAGSASAASGSATAAAGSASSASGSAQTATTKASEATAAKTAAETARDQAQAARDEILDPLASTYIRNTIVTCTLGENGYVSMIYHRDNVTHDLIRTDAFTYVGNIVTEVRTLIATGRTQTNVYDLDLISAEFNVGAE